MADVLALDGKHGDPSKRGGWIGHRDYAGAVVALIAHIRELQSTMRAVGSDLVENFVGEDREERYGIEQHGKSLIAASTMDVILP